jgi:integrase
MTETDIIIPDRAEITPPPDRPLDQNPAAVYLAGLSKGSRRTMSGALDTIAGMVSNGQHNARTFDWAGLRFQHTAAIRAELAERVSFTTANKMLSALRGTLKAAWKLGQMSAEEYHQARSIESLKGETVPAGRAITPGELAALLDGCGNDPSAAGARDGAIIAVLYSCGLRRAELVGLDLADYNQDAGELTVRAGKGRKERICPAVNGAADALADWVDVRGDEPGPLFYSVKGAHKGNRLTTQAIYKLLGKRAGQAGISHISPHDLRRTVAGDLLDAGADLVTVQKLLGQSDVNTTARYDRRPEAAKRKAVELLHVPYRRRSLID